MPFTVVASKLLSNRIYKRRMVTSNDGSIVGPEDEASARILPSIDAWGVMGLLIRW